MSSERNYLQPVNNYFNNDEDVDDDTFLANSRAYQNPKRSTNPFEEDIQQAYAQKRKEIEDRTFESSKRSLGLLYETEEVGKATAAELAKQREQLESSAAQLEAIDSTLRTSQRHLNGLKSVFWGLKNYISGNRDNMTPRTMRSPSANFPNEHMPSTSVPISPIDPYENHPINKIRNENIDGHQRYSHEKLDFDRRLESNLESMCDSLSRLKGLASDMRGEIESQNELLDNMNYRMEDVDIKLGKQNLAMNKLLGKK